MSRNRPKKGQWVVINSSMHEPRKARVSGLLSAQFAYKFKGLIFFCLYTGDWK